MRTAGLLSTLLKIVPVKSARFPEAAVIFPVPICIDV